MSLAGMFDLKDEEQAKQYLHTVGIEYRFQCFKEKLPEGCHRLADFFETFRQEYDKSFTVYRDNCEKNNYAHSCYKLGSYYYLGRACDKNLETAVKYYEQACEGKYFSGCYLASVIRLSNRLQGSAFGEPSVCKARDNLKAGCEGKDAECCYHLSNLYIQGRAPYIHRDMKEAFTFAKKGCDLGHIYACANLTQMYMRGEGTKKDPDMAAATKKKTLELHHEATKEHVEVEFQQTK